MDVASVLALAGGSSVVTALVTILGNGFFGWAKGRADTTKTEASTSEIFNKLAAESAARDAARAQRDDKRINKLVEALENLTDAVDRATPMLERLASNDDELDAARKLRTVNSIARLAI
jgi:DNA-binding transcriptional regulator GbsR (MarR family)